MPSTSAIRSPCHGPKCEASGNSAVHPSEAACAAGAHAGHLEVRRQISDRTHRGDPASSHVMTAFQRQRNAYEPSGFHHSQKHLLSDRAVVPIPQSQSHVAGRVAIRPPFFVNSSRFSSKCQSSSPTSDLDLSGLCWKTGGLELDGPAFPALAGRLVLRPDRCPRSPSLPDNGCRRPRRLRRIFEEMSRRLCRANLSGIITSRSAHTSIAAADGPPVTSRTSSDADRAKIQMHVAQADDDATRLRAMKAISSSSIRDGQIFKLPTDIDHAMRFPTGCCPVAGKGGV